MAVDATHTQTDQTRADARQTGGRGEVGDREGDAAALTRVRHGQESEIPVEAASRGAQEPLALSDWRHAGCGGRRRPMRRRRSRKGTRENAGRKKALCCLCSGSVSTRRLPGAIDQIQRATAEGGARGAGVVAGMGVGTERAGRRQHGDASFFGCSFPRRS